MEIVTGVQAALPGAAGWILRKDPMRVRRAAGDPVEPPLLRLGVCFFAVVYASSAILIFFFFFAVVYASAIRIFFFFFA